MDLLAIFERVAGAEHNGIGRPEAAENLNRGSEIAANGDSSKLRLAILSDYRSPWTFRAEKQGGGWYGQALDLLFQCEVDLRVRAGQELSSRIWDVDFCPQGACDRINGVRGAHHFPGEALGDQSRNLNVWPFGLKFHATEFT